VINVLVCDVQCVMSTPKVSTRGKERQSIGPSPYDRRKFCGPCVRTEVAGLNDIIATELLGSPASDGSELST
jgi:hypothetical protein